MLTCVHDEEKIRNIKDKLIKWACLLQVGWTHGVMHPISCREMLLNIASGVSSCNKCKEISCHFGDKNHNCLQYFQMMSNS